MLDSFMLRSDYAEMAKAVNSFSAAITTVSLLSRVIARKTRFNGWWYDDYLLLASWVFLLVGNGLSAAAPAYGTTLQILRLKIYLCTQEGS